MPHSPRALDLWQHWEFLHWTRTDTGKLCTFRSPKNPDVLAVAAYTSDGVQVYYLRESLTREALSHS